MFEAFLYDNDRMSDQYGRNWLFNKCNWKKWLPHGKVEIIFLPHTIYKNQFQMEFMLYLFKK